MPIRGTITFQSITFVNSREHLCLVVESTGRVRLFGKEYSIAVKTQPEIHGETPVHMP